MIGSSGKYNFFSIISGVLIFLFCLSGRFTTGRIGIGDYEIRFLFAFICFVWTGVALARNGIRAQGSSVVFLCLLFFTVASLFAFRNETGGLVDGKVVDLGLLALLVVLGYCLFSNDFNAAKVFLMCMGAIGFLYALLVLLSVGDAARGSTGVGGSNVATRIIFLGLISLIFFAEYAKSKALYFFAPIYIAGIVGVGSRGGMLIGFVMIGVWLLVQIIKNFSESRSLSTATVGLIKKISVFILLAGGFLWLFFPIVSKVFQARFVNLLVDRVHYAGRDEIYSSAVDAIFDNIVFGLGLGGYEKIGISNYPHNLILELFLDGGIFLGVFFIVFLGFAIFAFLKSRASILSISGIYMISVQMFSGDYYDFRFYFLYMIIVLSFFILPSKKNC